MENNNTIFSGLIIEHPIDSYISKYRLETMEIDRLRPKFVTEKSVTREMEFIFMSTYNGLFRYQVLCFDTMYKSNNAIAAEHIVRRVGYIFDELKISADAQGNIVQLHNLDDIRERWRQTREELLLDNNGQAVEHYFLSIGNLLTTEETAIAFLKGPDMLGMYFNGWLGNYVAEKPRKKITGKLNFFEDSAVEETINAKQLEDTVKLLVTGVLANIEVCPPISEAIQQKNMAAIYKGTAIYKSNQLIESFLEMENVYTTIKYSALWVG